MDYTTMWAYPWDLADEGVDRALRCMRDEAGVGAVSLATAYHSVQHLRPRASGHRFFTAHEAALYFPPDRPRYRATSLQPRVSPMVVGGNPLREVAEGCQALGMGLISWTVALHNSHLGGHYPDVAVRNVFGDVIQAALCPAQEPVRAYVRALVDDLTTNYPLQAVEMESLAYPGARHSHAHEKVGVPLGPAGDVLLCVCFCDACRRTLAGRADVDAAAAAVRDTLTGIFTSGEAPSLSLPEYLAGQPALSGYLEARKEVVTSLVREVKEVCRAELIYIDMGDWWGRGADLAAIGAIADRLEVLCYGRDPDRTRAAVGRLAAATGDPRRVTVGFCAYPPATPDPETLSANVCAAQASGAGGFSFYHYGIMPARNLAWVRGAIGQLVNE